MYEIEYTRIYLYQSLCIHLYILSVRVYIICIIVCKARIFVFRFETERVLSIQKPSGI